jgi:hypothetical protein
MGVGDEFHSEKIFIAGVAADEGQRENRKPSLLWGRRG